MNSLRVGQALSQPSRLPQNLQSTNFPIRNPVLIYALMSLKPWREIIVPHPDVLGGTFQQSEFAATTAGILTGSVRRIRRRKKGILRTNITEGMDACSLRWRNDLTEKAVRPVIQLQTAFGGGKTHTMLAVYHLASRKCPLGDLVGIPALLDHAGLMDALGSDRRVDGVAYSPGQPWKHGKQVIRTLWGELAWQLGKAEGYALVQEADTNGTSLGKEVLCTLLARHAPCVTSRRTGCLYSSVCREPAAQWWHL